MQSESKERLRARQKNDRKKREMRQGERDRCREGQHAMGERKEEEERTGRGET